MSFPYTLDADLGRAATLGFVVLQSDETLEQDIRRLLPDQSIATYVTRIPSAEDLTADSIAQMKRDLPAAARLFPKPAKFDTVAYACTSGTTLIGAEAVGDLLRANCVTQHTTNPLTATLAACVQLGAKRIGLVSPYAADIAQDVEAAFQNAGLEVTRSVNFGERNEAAVVRMDAASLSAAAHEVAAGADAVFLSCTNLRTLDVIAPLEETLGVPVLSSNLCLIWHMAHQVGVTAHLHGPGRLLRAG